MTEAILANAAEALQQKSDQYSPLVLDAYLLEGPDGDSFLLVGVDETVDEAVTVYEDWNDEWGGQLTEVSSEPMDDHPRVTVHEYRVQGTT